MDMTRQGLQQGQWRSVAASLLGGPVLWFIHFNLAYTIVDFGCRSELSNPSPLVTLILIATIVALILTAFAGFTSYRMWKQDENERANNPEYASNTNGRTRFVGITGIFLNIIFAVGILMTTIPVFVVNVCEGIVA